MNKFKYCLKKINIILILTLIINAGIVASCSANTGNGKKVFGYYEFEENIYTNPVSSFLPLKGHMPYYHIYKNSLAIINKNGSKQIIKGSFKQLALKKNDFVELFETSVGIPDISEYKECYQYARFTAEDKPEYRLYKMDEKIWLTTVVNGKIWSIYRLLKTDKYPK